MLVPAQTKPALDLLTIQNVTLLDVIAAAVVDLSVEVCALNPSSNFLQRGYNSCRSLFHLADEVAAYTTKRMSSKLTRERTVLRVDGPLAGDHPYYYTKVCKSVASSFCLIMA